MAKISETELQRRLRKASGGGTNSGPTATEVGDSWEYSEAVLYLAYASNISNATSAGIITNQSDATGFQFLAFATSGTLLSWRGYLFSKSIYASGDPTDYIWEDISVGSSASTMERYYSTHPGLLTDMGNPDYPGTRPDGTAVPWTSIATSSSIPDTAFFLSERYTINSVTSLWNVYAVATEENGFGLIPYTITGRNKPALNSTQWNDDTILAVSAFTGRTYSSIKQFGYGTTVVITYDDGKLYGMLKKVSGVAAWVTPSEFIDGALLVDSTIIADKIANNAITVDKILDNAINSAKIAANAVNTSEIAANAITANEIQANAIGANEIAANSITAGEIAANAITTSELAAGSVTANELVANTITANEMAVASVTTTVLAANAVSADKVQANAITAGKLLVTGAGAVTPGTIGASTVAATTAAQATADSKVLAADVAAAINSNTTTIDGAKITTGTVQAAQVNLSPGDVGAGSSGSSGARMNITTSGIRIYDSSGNLRVTLGDLT